MRATLQRIAIATLASLTIVALTACGSMGSADFEQAERLFPKNQQTWALPLDAYQYNYDLLKKRASQLLEKDCMAKAGYDYPLSKINLDAPPSESLNPGGIRIFNEELAKRWGYRLAPDKQLDPVRERKAQAAFDAKLSDKGGETFDACIQEVDKKLYSGVSTSSLQLAASLAAQKDPADDPTVQEASKNWHECMKPVGLPSLPNTPDKMPGLVVEGMHGDGSETSIDSDGFAYEGKIPANEIKIAVKDAKCQESSGYAAARYEAEWKAQAEAYFEHEDELAKVKKANDDLKSKLRKVVQDAEK